MNVEKILVTGSNLSESVKAMNLCKHYRHRATNVEEDGTSSTEVEEINDTNSEERNLFCTVGVHPCHSMDIENAKEGADKYLESIEKLALEGKQTGVVKAFGEIGIDYDRLNFAPADVQRKYFEKQLQIAKRVGLPLFLHSRACHDDFISIMKPFLEHLPRGGVVHSFTGTLQEMKDYVALGLYIGINGCSLKTQENLDVVKEVPLDKLVLETDGPWCEIRPSHASHKTYLASKPKEELLPFEAVKKEKYKPGAMVRGRCEPCSILLVAQVVAGVKGISCEEVSEAAWKNTIDLFDM